MRRVLGVFVAAFVLSAASAFAQADKPAAKPATEKASAAAKSMNATGTVSSVAADSLTLKAKTGEMTFAVDSSTKVTARGASHKTAAMKDEKKATTVTDFVHVGDSVTVRYKEDGGKKVAQSVTVRSAAGPAK
jgi:hypothetical protein